jgi:hypothetical protein
MKEFYLKQEIPVEWEEEVRNTCIEMMKEKLPETASIRYEGYLAMGQDDFVIIYTTGE